MARTRVRYALVAELGSGLRATLSSHRRVDWANEEKAKSFLKTYPMIAQRAAAHDPSGYRIPDYSLFGPRSALKDIDPIVSLRMVPESEWSVAEHHTIPLAIKP